ncbi:MAG: ThiF family adenylyltransferase [Lachnospiraceae bacterium]
MKRLLAARVAVFGVGGVGGYVCEALARSGIGAIDICDNDTVAWSNLNRQIIATVDTVDRLKVDVMAERMHAIQPELQITTYPVFYTPETASGFDFTQYDYIVDAIDTITGKLELAVRAQEAGIPIISAMGAGNKLDASRFEVCDIYKTSVCPLARVMRKECKARGIKKLKVVYSKEEARKPEVTDPSVRKQTPGSMSYVPGVVGLMIAGEVIQDLLHGF